MQAMSRAAIRVDRRQPSIPERIVTPLHRATWRDWLYVLGQILLVAGIELTDDVFHAKQPLGNAASGVKHAAEVVQFEAGHGFWIEPGIQSFFAQTHQVLGHTVGWMEIRPIVNTMYGQGHVLITLFFALWVFFYRRGLFDLLRNVFVLTNILAVLLYEAFPLAPPRLAPNLRYDGRHVHFLDPVFGAGSGLKLSFNEYAAMPSVHVAWALIVGVTIAWASPYLILRLLGAIYPLAMLTTVVVTGNHYLSDGLGAMVVVSFALLVSVAFAWWRQTEHSLPAVISRLLRARYGADDDLLAAAQDRPQSDTSEVA